MASIKDVALDACVSVATVSYVYNKNKYVSPELTERVNASIRKLGYQGNRVARQLRKKKSDTIGIVVQNLNNVFFPQIFSGLEEYARARDLSLVFFNSYNDIALERNALMTLNDMWVDGIILDSCVRERDAADYTAYLDGNLSGKRIPMVFLERSLNSHSSGAVVVNNHLAAYEATRHLIGIGRRNIVHFGSDWDWSMVSDRKKGYFTAMRDFGLEGKCREGDMDPRGGFGLMTEILEGKQKVDGIFTVNDRMALGAVKAIQKAGMRIPDDIALVGYDNIFLSKLFTPTLTTVNVPKYTMGKEAARLIYTAVSDPQAPPETLALPTNLVIRASTDPSVHSEWDLCDE